MCVSATPLADGVPTSSCAKSLAVFEVFERSIPRVHGLHPSVEFRLPLHFHGIDVGLDVSSLILSEVSVRHLEKEVVPIDMQANK